MDAEEKASKKMDEMPKMQTQDEIQGISLCGQLCMVSLFIFYPYMGILVQNLVTLYNNYTQFIIY